MRNLIFNNILIFFIASSCISNNSQIDQEENETQRFSKLKSFSFNPKEINASNELVYLEKELGQYYPAKYSCKLMKGIIGDMNHDNQQDVLYRYSVDDIENQTWVACGWLLVFKNKNKEVANYQFFDWSSGRCARSDYDLGFPIKIENNIIYSEFTNYSSDDACCCPSIHKTLKLSYNPELQLLDLINSN
jgi:hypothetical protein